MSELHTNKYCKNCVHWARGLWDYPCRACNNEGRGAHPYPGDIIKNYYRRDPKKPAYVSDRFAENKRREMGL